MKPSALPNSLKALGSLAFVAAALLGWILAAPSRNNVSQPETSLVRTRHAERPARTHNVSAASAAAGQRMATIRATGSEEARIRATVEFANALPLTEFAAWLDGGWFNLRDGPEQTLPDGDAKLWAQKNLATNWKQYDPQAADRWVNSLPPDQRDQVVALMNKR